ncbi:hypothetical protein ACPV5L_13070 [Vibrio astriarenae]
MKKLALAAAVSVLMAGQVYADVDLSGEPVDFALKAEVDSTCLVWSGSEVIGFDTMDFGAPEANESLEKSIQFKCNDPDGATLTMISAQGGLTNIDMLSEKVKYDATLSVGGQSSTLETSKTENESTFLNLDGDSDLANPGKSAKVKVMLKESATYAGEYLDTLTIQIAAR